MQVKNLAAIDLGTNDCRLVVADQKGKRIFRQTEQVRLGEGLAKQGNFSSQAMERGWQCLAQYARLMRENHVDRYRAIATASCRMAENSVQFVQMVEELSGIKLEVISPLEEAVLTLKGALLNADRQKPYVLVFDIGGGSTEMTLATNEECPRILYTVSIPLGARTAAEKYDILEYDDAKVIKLQDEIKQHVQSFLINADFLRYKKQCHCLATSSVPLRLASMIENRKTYERDEVDGKTFAIDRFYEAIHQVYHMTLVEMEQNPHIGEKRAPIFVASCVIFATICRILQIDALTSSLKGAQEAVIMDLVSNEKAGIKWQS